MSDAPHLLFDTAGRILHGPTYTPHLAEDLGVSERTIRRWRNDGYVPPGVWLEVCALLRRHSEEARQLAERLPT